MKTKLLTIIIFIGFNSFIFAQSSEEKPKEEKRAPIGLPHEEPAKAHEGISFVFPSGSWVDVPKIYSLAPFMYNKIEEKTESDKKVTVIYKTSSGTGDVPSLIDETPSALNINWGKVTVVTPRTLISNPFSLGTQRKFSTVFRGVELLTETVFRIEVVIVSSFKMEGNKGVVYIICPEYSYYDNRYLIASIKDALKIEDKKEQNSDSNSSSSTTTKEEQATV